MDKIDKFYGKLTAKERKFVYAVLEKLLRNDVSTVKFKKLKGYEDLYTIRIGKIRIICVKTKNKYIPVDMDYRKNIYRGI